MPKKSDYRKGMPKWDAVFEFWASTSIAIIKHGFPKSVTENRCFACGVPYPEGVKLERAHIQPLWTGGPNDASNLHLLCHVCHKDSEDLGRPDKPKGEERYWAWFFSRNMRKRALSSRLRSGDPGVFEGIDGCDGEKFLKAMKLIESAFEFQWELLDAIARANGFECWDQTCEMQDRIVYV